MSIYEMQLHRAVRAAAVDPPPPLLCLLHWSNMKPPRQAPVALAPYGRRKILPVAIKGPGFFLLLLLNYPSVSSHQFPWCLGSFGDSVERRG